LCGESIAYLKVSDDWGLIAGDAFHNLRCALDHLAWQLAIRKYNGAAPAERRIIKEIQFPIVLDRDKWSAHRNRIHMLAEDAAKIEKFQPFEMPADDEEQVLAHPLSGLAGFNGFDNIDKHRTLHLTYFVLKDFRAGMSPNAKYTDCVPILESDFPVVFDSITSERPKVGDEVMRAMVRPTGPNPDVDFEPRLTGFVAIGESCDILYALQAMHDAVSSVIEEFEPPLGTVVA